MNHKIELLIVDDDRAFRHELAGALEGQAAFRVSGLAAHGLEAIKMVSRLRPDVVLMDLEMPGLPGAEVARRIRRMHPRTRILFLAEDKKPRPQSPASGVDGVFLKRLQTAELIEALDAIHSAPQQKRAIKLPRRKKAPPKVVPWLAGALRMAGLALLVGVVISKGTLLSYIALISGAFFFVYAMRYYLSMGLIMAASGGNGANGHANGNGWLGLRNGNGFNGHKNGNGHTNGSRLNGLKNGNGLGNGNGAKGRLKHQPFVSIHLPMFNESRVVDRLLTAATSLDYENYEVIVADDSSDKTVTRLEEWARHPRVKVSHRINRSGFKGAALHHAMEVMDPRAEFLVIFDADFVPPPQIIWQFLDYFYGYPENGNGNGHGNGNGNTDQAVLLDESIAAVQGYQWHMLNADENWLTKGVRAEYSGSYVIERSGQQLLGTMKMISGSVYMIRADALREAGWGTSITEDWELTLKLYVHGYKVLYTPFIQAPSECVSTFGRLVRQRMRWAEGHTYNVRKYFLQVMTSTKISWREKLEFLYYAPYYLQSLFFTIGTVSWFFSETILHHTVPYWTSLLGWSLVFSNMGALTLMNLSGLFMERGVKKEWTGVLSAVALGMLLVPFQGYAALKGLLEVEEGGWFRTPKTGKITKFVNKLNLGGKLDWLQPQKRKPPARLLSSRLVKVTGLALLLSNPARLANTLIGGGIALIMILSFLSPLVPVAEAAPDTFYLRTTTLNDGRQMTRGVAGSSATTLAINSTGLVKWYSSEIYPTGNDDASIPSGTYTFTLDYNRAAANSTITFTAQVGLSNSDGTGYTQFGESTSQTTANAGGNLTLAVTICTSCAAQTITAAAPQRLVMRINVTAVLGSGITLRYEGAAGGTSDSRLDTPTIVVPEHGWALVPFAVLLPSLILWDRQRRRQRRAEIRAAI